MPPHWWFAAFLCGLLAFAAGCDSSPTSEQDPPVDEIADPPPDPQPEHADYMPLAVGKTWTYARHSFFRYWTACGNGACGLSNLNEHGRFSWEVVEAREYADSTVWVLRETYLGTFQEDRRPPLVGTCDEASGEVRWDTLFTITEREEGLQFSGSPASTRTYRPCSSRPWQKDDMAPRAEIPRYIAEGDTFASPGELGAHLMGDTLAIHHMYVRPDQRWYLLPGIGIDSVRTIYHPYGNSDHFGHTWKLIEVSEGGTDF